MIRPFNRNVLIGNWYEDRVLEEDVIKDYLEKRDNNQLLTQKEAAKQKPQPNCLTTSPDNRIRFGDTILIRCEGTENKPIKPIAKANRTDCYLSTTEILQDSNTAMAAGISHPVLSEKTALVIQSVDGTLCGNAVKFGQPFTISTIDKSLYLHSDTRLYDRAAHRSRLQTVDFQTVYNHECDWVATCLNPKFRLECEGAEIPANEKILILHMKTNKALAVVTDFNRSNRFEIVAHTFLDSHKAEEDVNHWQLLTNIPTVAQPDTCN